ncbi:MAG: hypothetical protein K6G29_02800 [Clostridiales bacterium]|nr:hypothetical protein [Clostridiales bacterium]
MKPMRKALSLLLALLLLCPLFAACSEKSPDAAADPASPDPAADNEQTAAEAVPETEEDPLDPAVLYDGLPSDGYGGYEFLMLIRPNDRWIADMAADELNGEAINDAIFRRNSMVAEKFDVAIRYEESSNYNYETDAMTSIRAGDDAYDLVIPHGRASFLYANQMLCLDWNTALPYISLDSPWWSQDARKSFSILGKLFVMNGDISYNSLGSADVMLFNKQLMTDLGIPFPYETVREGAWTYDLWASQVESASADLNGDGMIKEDDDRLGYVTQKWVGPMEAFATSGLRVLSKDEDDTPYLSFYSEKTVDVFNRYFALIDSDAAYVDTADVSYSSGFIGIFEESRALFTDMNMTDVITLRTMETDFGVIPWPKYDEQSEYCTNVDAGTNLFLVPITASDPARTSAIVEALCRIGERLVLPAYYEVTLQSKASRDNESADMLDIIKSALIFDLGYYNSELSGAFNNEFVDFVGSANRDITSWYEKNAKAVTKTLEKNVDKYRD